MNTTDLRYLPLNDLNTALDELLGCQKEEQEAILKRQTAQFPVINARIEILVQKVQSIEQTLQGVWPSPQPIPEPWNKIGMTCLEKLRQLQEITLQNHLLLENGLRFLQEVFQEVLGKQDQSPVYNQFGSLPIGYQTSGSFLNAQV